ncbi:TPA: hypothetical protein ACKP7E_000402 [Pseudomonas aeruginosa]
MSSTQHQLIEQCATRLRGIVEALDNIHDTSPHRWSTDLDDVHSSAESLLALIKDQAPTQAAQGLADAALAQPSPMRCLACGGYHGNSGLPCPNMRVTAQAQPSPAQAEQHWPKLEKPAQVGAIRFSAGVSSRLVVEAAQRLYEFESTPEKEAERPEVVAVVRAKGFGRVCEAIDADTLYQHCSEGEPLMTVAQHERIVGALRADNERLRQGMKGDYDIDAWLEWAKEKDRIVGALRRQVSVLALGAEQAMEQRDAALAKVAELEAELETEHMRLAACSTAALGYFDGCADAYKSASLSDVLRLRADCDAALARVAELERQEPVVRAYGVLPPFAEKVLAKLRRFYDCAEDFESGGVDIGRHWLDLLTQLGLLNRVQRSPALWEISQQGEDLLEAPVAQAQQLNDLDKQCRDDVARALGLRPNQERGFAWSYLLASIKSCVKASGDSAQAQHSAGYAEARQCVNCRHIGINDAADYAACHDCRWTGPEPDEDKCPGCAGENCMAAACPECGGRYELVAEAKISTPAAQAGQMPQAWLDVQAERRRQSEAEGWTPEHDDEHSHGQMARAAACYALAGSSAPNDGTAALLVSLAWPWDEQWWKPSTARRDLVKAGALVLAEIERIDRAGISQSPQPGAATTASS